MRTLVAGDRQVPWSCALPSKWTWQPIKYEAFINVEVLPETTPPDLEVRYIDIGGVDGQGTVSSIESHRFESAPSRARRVVRSGDTLVSTVRTYLKAIAYIGEDEPGLTASTGFAVLRAGKHLVPKFMFYWARSTSFVDEVCARSVGVSYPAINGLEIGSLPIPLPPLDTQRAVVAFLDRKTAAIDALVAKKERLIELLDEKRQAVIKQAVTRGLDSNAPLKGSGVGWLGRIPAGWQVVRLGALCRIGNGSTPSREEPDYWSESGFPWLNSAKVNAEVALSADRFVTSRALRECHLPQVRAGSVLVAITGEGQTRGRAALLDHEATISQHLAFLTPRDSSIDSRFLLRHLQTRYQWLRSESEGGGSTKGALTCEFLRSIRLAVPPIEEQAQIVESLRRRLGSMDNVALRSQLAIEVLREYRQALIAAAVTGKIDVRSTEAA